MTDGQLDIAVVLPSWDGSYRFEMMTSTEAMMSHSQKLGRRIHLYRSVGSGISIRRNAGLAYAKANNCDFMLQVDSDTIVTNPEYLETLIAHNLPVVSGMYHGKQYPFVPIAAKWNEEEHRYHTLLHWEDGALIEVDAVGAGFLLVRKDVFDIPPPAFMEFALDEGVSDKIIGEDYYFCRKAKANGFSVHLDTSVKLGHIGFQNFDHRSHEAARDHSRRMFEAEQKKQERPEQGKIIQLVS